MEPTYLPPPAADYRCYRALYTEHRNAFVNWAQRHCYMHADESPGTCAVITRSFPYVASYLRCT